MSAYYQFSTELLFGADAPQDPKVKKALEKVYGIIGEPFETSWSERDEHRLSLLVEFTGDTVSGGSITAVDSVLEELGALALEAAPVEFVYEDDPPGFFVIGPDADSIDAVNRAQVTTRLQEAIVRETSHISSLSIEQKRCLKFLEQVIDVTLNAPPRTLVLGATSSSSPDEPDGFVEIFDGYPETVREEIAGHESEYAYDEVLFYRNLEGMLALTVTLGEEPENRLIEAKRETEEDDTA